MKLCSLLLALLLDRAAGELHGTALRLSIAWSRVFPVSTIGVPDLRAVASAGSLAYYHAVFAAMKARGLVPLVTLNHYTLPAFLNAVARGDFDEKLDGRTAQRDDLAGRATSSASTTTSAPPSRGWAARSFRISPHS